MIKKHDTWRGHLHKKNPLCFFGRSIKNPLRFGFRTCDPETLLLENHKNSGLAMGKSTEYLKQDFISFILI